MDQFVRVAVKWFNQSKGHGFVSLTVGGPGSEAIFLHVVILRRGSIDMVDGGEVLRARVQRCAKGTVAAVIVRD